MTTLQSEMERKTHINAKEPLTDKLDEVYNKIIDSLHKFNESYDQRSQFATDKEYNEAITVIANHIYLIYERLYLNIVREINYNDIKYFATNNKKFVKHILRKNFPQFSIEALDKWTQVHIDLLECAMYRSNNRYNKHLFH